MSITKNPLIFVWNILQYSLRIWNGKQKNHDIEKIAHYAELAWTMSGGKVIKTDKRGRKRPHLSPPDASPAAIFD